ncbi:MAG: STAS domain-containing protein [Treponema sp.]|jgi:anti-sigma B factor antagonist|nr:STAS domain-containing protein [Treponema sp.]
MVEDSFEITQAIEDGICRFTVKGRIDTNSADEFQSKMEDALKNGQKIIILNMSSVEYLSSIGIRVILKIYKQAAEADGSLKIEQPSEIVSNVLNMVALKEMIVK